MKNESGYPEKLVEEVTKLVHQFWIDTQHGHTPRFERSFSRVLIDCIGEAALSGEYPELNKLLGVVGRGTATHANAHLTLPLALQVLVKKGATSFIALRKEGIKEQEE